MKYNILYVDDEKANLRVFKSVFRKSYNIFTSTSGKEGLKIVDHEKLDLIVTDQRMPNMTGLEFLKIVHEKFPGTPPSRIMLSGYSETKDIKEAKDKYCLFKFVSKPWQVRDLKLNMDNAITNAFKS